MDVSRCCCHDTIPRCRILSSYTVLPLYSTSISYDGKIYSYRTTLIVMILYLLVDDDVDLIVVVVVVVVVSSLRGIGDPL